MKDRHGNKLEIGDTVRAVSPNDELLVKDTNYQIDSLNDNEIYLKSYDGLLCVNPNDVEKVDDIIYEYVAQFPDGSYYVWCGENANNKTFHLNHATRSHYASSFDDFKDAKVLRVMVNLKIIS